jgi:endogenous inhibitor of DNA gyrase (YacG/DUF329 family)
MVKCRHVDLQQRADEDPAIKSYQELVLFDGEC